ncbi:MAG TPA: hypothetical protein VFF29_03040 [Bacteroidota bacterium]|nr:hypothetical protein [Bacteroidota bacterium]
MIRLIVALVIGISIFQPDVATSQGNDIIDFYRYADSVCSFPPIDQELVKVCQKRLQDRYVTFIGIRGYDRVLIAAVTLQPIRDVKKSISLTVEFDGMKPTTGKTSTWGYLFDRNGDGNIDYMALVGGAGAFKKRNFPEDYPVRGQYLTYDQIEYFVNNCKLVFNHWADDNFDNMIDAVIHIDMDPSREWVNRQLVVRSTSFDGEFDEVWAFRERIDSEYDTLTFTSDKVPYHPIGKPQDAITKSTLMEKTGILQLINRAVAECKLSKGVFLPKSEEE